MRGYSPESCLQQNNYYVLLDSYFILSYKTFLFFSVRIVQLCVCELFMKEMSTLCQSQLDATRHDILDYYKGCTTPNGDIRRALPLVVEKIFGYLDQDALTQARAVS